MSDLNMGGVAGNDSTQKAYTRTSKSRVHWAVDWQGKDDVGRCKTCGLVLSVRYSDNGKVSYCRKGHEQ